VYGVSKGLVKNNNFAQRLFGGIPKPDMIRNSTFARIVNVILGAILLFMGIILIIKNLMK
jgi:hypothetical protein